MTTPGPDGVEALGLLGVGAAAVPVTLRGLAGDGLEESRRGRLAPADRLDARKVLHAAAPGERGQEHRIGVVEPIDHRRETQRRPLELVGEPRERRVAASGGHVQGDALDASDGLRQDGPLGSLEGIVERRIGLCHETVPRRQSECARRDGERITGSRLRNPGPRRRTERSGNRE